MRFKSQGLGFGLPFLLLGIVFEANWNGTLGSEQIQPYPPPTPPPPPKKNKTFLVDSLQTEAYNLLQLIGKVRRKVLLVEFCTTLDIEAYLVK